MALSAATVFRDYETDGVPASGAHKVKKAEVREIHANIDQIINAILLSEDVLIYSNLAGLNSDLAHPAHTMAWVMGDTAANSGIYEKLGSSGSGSWVKLGDLPISFIIASDVGAGTANAIQATTSIAVSSSALVWMNVFEANTSSPVTVSFNGGSALTVKTNTGNNVAAGGLVSGMIILGIVSGSTFRLVSDQASAAIVAAAEAAQAAAQAAQAAAETAAASIPAEAAVRIIEFDIRMSQFAGGAPMNGVDDDAPAIQAAVDYVKTLGTRYGGGMGVIRLPRGQIRLESSIDLYADSITADNVRFEGEGSGATNINITGDFPGFVSTADAANTLYRTQFVGFTVTGPGRSNTNAHAFDIDALNGGLFEDIHVFSCRRAFSLGHLWQTTMIAVRASAPLGNALSCYDGLYMKDGEAAIFENAVEILGGKITGCERYGFRGESITGSYVSGLEVLGCGNAGVYLGDSPSGKDLKWFTWVGGLIDTCPDLLVINKGSSTVAERMHFSGLWLGYASSGSGNGDAIRLSGLNDVTVIADKVANVDVAINVTDCTRLNIKTHVISGYDRSLVGAGFAVVHNTVDSRFDFGTAVKTATSPNTTCFTETGTSARNEIEGIADGLVFTIAGNGSRFSGRMVYGGSSRIAPAHLPEIAKASIPTASTFWAGKMIMVTDETGGYVPAFCDGTNWRRVTDRAVVS